MLLFSKEAQTFDFVSLFKKSNPSQKTVLKKLKEHNEVMTYHM